MAIFRLPGILISLERALCKAIENVLNFTAKIFVGFSSLNVSLAPIMSYVKV